MILAHALMECAIMKSCLATHKTKTSLAQGLALF